MKEFMVSFDATNRSASLGELVSALGLTPGVGSRERGAPGPRDPRKMTVFRLESTAPKNAPLVDHLESLFAMLPSVKSRLSSLPDGTELSLSIGVLFDTVSGSLEISPWFAEKLLEYGLTLDVTWYITDFGTEEDSGVPSAEA